MKPGTNSKGKVLKKNPQLGTRAYNKGEKKQQIQTNNFCRKTLNILEKYFSEAFKERDRRKMKGLELDDL